MTDLERSLLKALLLLKNGDCWCGGAPHSKPCALAHEVSLEASVWKSTEGIPVGIVEANREC